MSAPRKKLIEVALPLEAINKEAAREKSIRHGHPSTLHLWWARRPLAACRAVLWASLVDDPSSLPEEFPTEQEQVRERERLFRILERLVKWESSNNEDVLREARAEIMKSTGGNPPPVLDPFCGGGSIPLEAQRLGLEAHASDLNPVAVLITKALIEIPPKFANLPPANPEDRGRGMGAGWKGAAGLAADVRYYGKWMRDEAERRIGHLYPKAQLPPEYGGGTATVIAWLWARTMTCPNPACGAQMPLVRSFWLSTKPTRKTWVEPLIDKPSKTVQFEVRTGQGAPREGTKQRGKSECLICGTNNITDSNVREQAKRYGLGLQPMAIVVEGKQSRIYLNPVQSNVDAALQGVDWLDQPMPDNPRWFSPPSYGLTTYRDLFTVRQLIALTTLAELVDMTRERVQQDALAADLSDDDVPLSRGGRGVRAYADCVATYLALALSRLSNYASTVCTWHSGIKYETLTSTFGRQAVPMSWDFAEGNPFSESSGNFLNQIAGIRANLEMADGTVLSGEARQAEATSVQAQAGLLVSTDPPYYDNMGYSDLADFFYLWLRLPLGRVYPELFGTLLTPKSEELIASPYRHGGNAERARRFFEDGLGKAFARLRAAQHPDFPLTVYYAFKQSESQNGQNEDGSSVVTASTGWETMLEAMIRAGFSITGTWPMRTELIGNLKKNVGALASSIVLVCRPRPHDAPLATRREFTAALKQELPDALRKLQQGGVAPVDLAQAAIGPGMAVYSRYVKVLESDDSRLGIRTALQLINQALDEVLTEQEGEYDSATRWAIAWYEQHGMEDGPFGQADVLARAKDTAVGTLSEAGVVHAQGGKVRLLRRDELPDDWDPATDQRLTIWELTQHLIHTLDEHGEERTARLLACAGGLGETARDLAYRLYATCERKKWAQEALDYNALVVAWPEISRLAGSLPSVPTQDALL